MGEKGYDWSSYDCTDCDDRNLMDSNIYQKDLLDSEQIFSYWAARLAVGDPFARAALKISLVSKIRGLAQVREASPTHDTARFQYI